MTNKQAIKAIYDAIPAEAIKALLKDGFAEVIHEAMYDNPALDTMHNAMRNKSKELVESGMFDDEIDKLAPQLVRDAIARKL